MTRSGGRGSSSRSGGAAAAGGGEETYYVMNGGKGGEEETGRGGAGGSGPLFDGAEFYDYAEDPDDDNAGVRVARTTDGRRVVVKLSTALYPNRIRDKLRVETQLKLPEGGSPSTAFYARRSGGLLIATGYDRIVYGDHGPYIEFSDHHIRWSSFPRYKPRSPWSYYDLWCTADQRLELYAQKRRVTSKPNPPSGQWSVCNHRPEGYADYRPGKCYVPCEIGDIEAVIQPIRTPPPCTVPPPDRSQRTSPERMNGAGERSQRNGAALQSRAPSSCSSPAPVRASMEEWRLSELEGLAAADIAGFVACFAAAPPPELETAAATNGSASVGGLGPVSGASAGSGAAEVVSPPPPIPQEGEKLASASSTPSTATPQALTNGSSSSSSSSAAAVAAAAVSGELQAEHAEGSPRKTPLELAVAASPAQQRLLTEDEPTLPGEACSSASSPRKVSLDEARTPARCGEASLATASSVTGGLAATARAAERQQLSASSSSPPLRAASPPPSSSSVPTTRGHARKGLRAH